MPRSREDCRERTEASASVLDPGGYHGIQHGRLANLPPIQIGPPVYLRVQVPRNAGTTAMLRYQVPRAFVSTVYNRIYLVAPV